MLNRDLYPFKSNYLTFNGLRHHYIDEGQGEVIVMVHGNPTWSYYYRNLIKALSRRYRVIAPDHIGMGLSDKPADDRYAYTASQRMRDIERLIDHLKITKFTLVGHDWGGIIGTAYATHHPEQIEKMILFNTAGFLWPVSKKFPLPLLLSRAPLSPLFIRGLNAFLRIAMLVGFKQKVSKEIKKGYYHPYGSWRKRIAIHRFVQDIPARPGDASYEFAAIMESRLKLLRKVPKLIIWGMKDFVFCPVILDEWLRHFPDAEVHRFDDAGHFVLEDKIDMVLPLVETFLAREIRPFITGQAEKAAQPGPHSIGLIDHMNDIMNRRAETLACASTRGWRSGRAVYDTITFARLATESDNLAHGLAKTGIARGMRTVFMVPPGPDFFTYLIALIKIGAIPVLVDPGMGIKNLKTCIDEVSPVAFVGVPRAHAARILFRWARASIKINVTVGTGWYPWKSRTHAEIRKRGSRTAPYLIDKPANDDTMMIAFTSGNTGIPKGVIYTYGMISSQIAILQKLVDPQEHDVYLATFPPFALMGPATGITSVIPDMDPTKPAKADPRKLLKALDDFHCTKMFASPVIIENLGRYCENHNIQLTSLTMVLSAGAPARIASLERFTRLLNPGVQIFTPYGATEALPVTMVGSDFILNETADRTKNGAGVCVGRPIHGIDIAIIGISEQNIPVWSEGLRLPAGPIGEICVKGPHVTAVYFNRPDQTLRAKIPDTTDGGIWHRMGDVGYLDNDGNLWMCGRKAHRVETSAGTLYSAHEDIFNNHPSVYRSAIVGVKTNGTTAPVLCVEIEKGVSLSAREKLRLRNELIEMGGATCRTGTIRTVLFHPEFPVDIRHNAKIIREKLAVWARGELS